jgi:hemerythrin-like domain-containing protein
MTIKEFMTQQHRECDSKLTFVEDAIEKKDFDDAMMKYMEFKNETLHHFSLEEDYLFPMFEEKSGMGNMGPTQVMRMEHDQARGLFSKMDVAINDKDSDRYYGLSDSMLILLQQHNAKEEQMLYTLIQNTFNAQNDEIVEKLRSDES